MAIYARDRAETQQHGDGTHCQVAPQLLELDTYLKYEKQLHNLHLQESRLLRRFEKERKELAALQSARQEQQQQSEPASPPAGSELPEPSIPSASRPQPVNSETAQARTSSEPHKRQENYGSMPVNDMSRQTILNITPSSASDVPHDASPRVNQG